MMKKVDDHRSSHSIEEMRRMISDNSYVANAIQRIAQVLSDQIIEIQMPGAPNERQR